MAKTKVLLGMSGGVDSSMSTWYLQQMNYEVIGITFNTISPISSDNSHQYIKEAKELADKLNIKHHVIDVYDDFKSSVIDYFVDEYLNGRTPNPCIRCNETIKWKLLYEESIKLQCDKIATGHYVRLFQKDNISYIQKGIDPIKDQSYFLWNLPQHILNKCVFPLGNFHKYDVKEKARSLGFNHMAGKKESMGVCFLQGENYRTFIGRLRPEINKQLANGIIKNLNGDVIGEHEGFPLYTIGQKRGLTLNKNHGECVAEIDPENNILITAPKETLYSDSLKIKNYILCNPLPENESMKVDIRIRGLDAVPPTPGVINIKDEALIVLFDTPVWALTPGQSIVLYVNDIVIGGGIVDEYEFNASL